MNFALAGIGPDETLVIFVRHGKTISQERGKIRQGGGMNPPLGPEGVQQAVLTGHALSALENHPNFSAIYYSPLDRTTAMTLHLVPPKSRRLHPLDALIEKHWGPHLEGKTLEQIAEQREWVANELELGDEVMAPGGEDPRLFNQRVMRGVERIYRENKGKIVVVVAHHGVISTAINSLKRLAVRDAHRIPLSHGSISIVTISKRPDGALVGKLHLLNCKTHLQKFAQRFPPALKPTQEQMIEAGVIPLDIRHIQQQEITKEKLQQIQFAPVDPKIVLPTSSAREITAATERKIRELGRKPDYGTLALQGIQSLKALSDPGIRRKMSPAVLKMRVEALLNNAKRSKTIIPVGVRNTIATIRREAREQSPTPSARRKAKR